MKTRLKCDLKAKDSDVECANCGAPFSYVSDEPDPDYQSHLDQIENLPLPSPPPLKVETSPWIKTIAVCFIALICLLGWQQFTASKLADCGSKALQRNSFMRILDVRMNGFDCEYLMEVSTFGAEGVTPKPAEWVGQSSIDMFMEMENDVRN